MLADSEVCTVMPSPWPRAEYSPRMKVGFDVTNFFLYRFEIREIVIMSGIAYVGKNGWSCF